MSKKAPYNVTDVDALQAAYPNLVTERTVVIKDIDHAKLYAIVKAKIVLEEALPPGVELRVKADAPPQTTGSSTSSTPSPEPQPMEV